MIYVVYVFAVLFIGLGAAMFYVFYRERHFGMFLMGMTYSMSGLLAMALPHWWPLVAGFVMAWMLKMLGLELEPEEVAGAAPPSRDEGGGMRDEGKAGSEPPSRQQDR
jgi:hypothetical protein